MTEAKHFWIERKDHIAPRITLHDAAGNGVVSIVKYNGAISIVEECDQNFFAEMSAFDAIAALKEAIAWIGAATMKLPINDSFAIQVTTQTNIELEEARQRTLASRYPHMAPQEPVRLSIAEVNAVLTALHVLGHYTPPLWGEQEPQP